MTSAKHIPDLIHLFSKYLLSVCYMPDTALSARDIQMVLPFMEHTVGKTIKRILTIIM